MAKVYALYRVPTDAAAFERYYFDKHVPLAKTIPACAATRSRAGRSPRWAARTVSLIATLTFDSRAAIDAALASPQGQAVAATCEFASGGVDVLIADTERCERSRHCVNVAPRHRRASCVRTCGRRRRTSSPPRQGMVKLEANENPYALARTRSRHASQPRWPQVPLNRYPDGRLGRSCGRRCAVHWRFRTPSA